MARTRQCGRCLLDYDTGELEKWLATDLQPNATQDVWTLTLRDGVKSSDSKSPAPGKPGDKPFTAEDVVFTVQMAIGVVKTAKGESLDLPALEAVTLRAPEFADVRQGKKPSGAPDPLTVIFKLKTPNPRFKLENFGGTLFSSFLIMPKHVWRDIVKFDDPVQCSRPVR